MNDHRMLIDFILEKAQEEPISKRIKLYRAVTVMLPEKERGDYRRYANDLEQIERQADLTRRQLQLALESPSQKAEGSEG